MKKYPATRLLWIELENINPIKKLPNMEAFLLG
jgi:hypothetical protein